MQSKNLTEKNTKMRKNKDVNFPRLLLISIVAALGGLLFGFDIAIITGAGPYLTIAFDLNSIQEGWALIAFRNNNHWCFINLDKLVN